MTQVRTLILSVLLVLVLAGCASPFDQDPSQAAVDTVYVDRGRVEVNRTDEAKRDENDAARKRYAAALQAQIKRDEAEAFVRDALNTIGITAATIVIVGGAFALMLYAGAGGWYLWGQARARSRMIMPNKRGDFPAYYDAKTGKLININLMTSPLLFVDAFEQLSEPSQVSIFTALQRTRIARALSEQKVYRLTAQEERKLARTGAPIKERDDELPDHITATWRQLEADQAAKDQALQIAAPRGVMVEDNGTEVQLI